MLTEKLIGVLLFAYTLLCNCHTQPASSDFSRSKKEYQVQGYARLPVGLGESSGMVKGEDGSFWILQDGGNPSKLYRIQADGQPVDTLALELPNNDWESLARDAAGNLYIGDFGNNFHNRKNLRIFRYNLHNRQIDTISFYYPEQQSFPPAERKDRNYDAEAFLWHEGRLHLFTKSYGDRLVRHYSLPDSAGSYAARLEEQRHINGLITGAALSPDGQTLALLSYGKLYLLDVLNGSDFLQNPRACISLPGRAQTEALVFLNNTNILLTNEQRRLIYVSKTEK